MKNTDTDYPIEMLSTWHELSTMHVKNLTYQIKELLDSVGIDEVVMLDVGSNSGKFTELLGELIYIKDAILIEPHPDLMNYAKALHGNKYNYEQIALSDYDGDGMLNVGYGNTEIENGLNLGISRLMTYETPNNITIDVKMFDTLWQEKYKSFKPNFIKIDAEDSDIQVLLGMKEFLTSLEHKPIIVYEFAGYGLDLDTLSVIETQLEFLKTMGYKPIWHDKLAPKHSGDIAIMVS